nr:integrase, catalytic region, zinc finger, CCHC-type, peptidase aspartic, catalytic [Tanacetum cinerariifolium]
NVARFAEMHVANTSVEARCIALEAELATLPDKSHQENQRELIKYFSKLKVDHLNIQLKYQNLKDIIGNNPPTPDKDTPDFDSVFVIGKMKASLQGKDNAIHQLKKQLSKLQVPSSDTERSQQRAKHLANTPLIRKKQVTISKPSDRQDSNKQVHVVAVKPQKTNVLVPPSTGVTSYPKARGSQPKRNPKTNKIPPAKGANKMPIEDLPRTNKSHLRTTNRVDSSSRLKRTVINLNSDSMCRTCNKCFTSFDHDMCVAICMKSIVRPYSTRHNCEVKRKIKQVWKPKHVERKMKQVWKPKQVGKVVQIVLWYLDSGYSKHMTGDRLRLLNFMKKFIGTVQFGNDHFGSIMGYGDYVVGESVISRVYYVEGLGHNLFSVRQFCDFDLEVAFRKHLCYVRDTDVVDLIKGSRGSNLYTILVEDMMKSSSICLLSKESKNRFWLWHRRLNHLTFGTINDLARKDLV